MKEYLRVGYSFFKKMDILPKNLSKTPFKRNLDMLNALKFEECKQWFCDAFSKILFVKQKLNKMDSKYALCTII